MVGELFGPRIELAPVKIYGYKISKLMSGMEVDVVKKKGKKKRNSHKHKRNGTKRIRVESELAKALKALVLENKGKPKQKPKKKPKQKVDKPARAVVKPVPPRHVNHGICHIKCRHTA
ncbi:uncharacterized protein LOC124645263 [Helicoverpa zea]|uniref:uncharacterized protein LOC124645263 n=1 Tax=Helicoverpa zea TaxID=7113 RepID=UPI001F55BC70|nr:uncharacterized protein LOC124645263 [Helicoverpa zea]